MIKSSIVFTLVLIFLSSAIAAEVTLKEESILHFNEMTKVLQHPRCLNCHVSGRFPTQGMDLHNHAMNVQRGSDNQGAVGMRCATCHGTENNRNSKVPGAPNWALAPLSMRWQGLSKRELCLSIKDPKKNNNMNLEKLIKHNAEDKLVGWGWNPGEDREPAPGTQKEFGALTAQWVASGAECPK